MKETQIESDSGNDGNRIYQARETGFKLDDFDLIRVIGRGSYAKVKHTEIRCSGFSTVSHFLERILMEQ